MFKRSKQMSESIEVGIILAIVGGIIDSYSYMCRDHVFANAQTGNIILLGIKISENDFSSVLQYLFPVISFTIGIILADIVRLNMKDRNIIHWRQISLFIEMLLLISVSFISQNYNSLANILISFACGIQVETYRKMHGFGIATTMCIGNLRGATQSICEYYYKKDKEVLKKGLLYYGIIISFVIGAILGNFLVKIMKEKAILIGAFMIFIVFLLMFIDREKKINDEK